jgi:hypothetical protein
MDTAKLNFEVSCFQGVRVTGGYNIKMCRSPTSTSMVAGELTTSARC